MVFEDLLRNFRVETFNLKSMSFFNKQIHQGEIKRTSQLIDYIGLGTNAVKSFAL